MKHNVYVNANGFEVEKICKPYGAAPKKDKKFKKEKHVRRSSVYVRVEV